MSIILRPSGNIPAGNVSGEALPYDEDLGTKADVDADETSYSQSTLQLTGWGSITYAGKRKILRCKHGMNVATGENGGTGNPSAGAQLRYWDGAWQTIVGIQAGPGDDSDSLSLDTYEYTIPRDVDMDIFKIQAIASASGESPDTGVATHDLYEIWLEVYNSHAISLFL
jgi:hypothetical protein